MAKLLFSMFSTKAKKGLESFAFVEILLKSTQGELHGEYIFGRQSQLFLGRLRFLFGLLCYYIG